MKLTLLAVGVVCCGIVWSISVSGEVVLMKDGTKFEGSLTRTSDGYELKDATGKVVQINANDVQSITIGSKAAGPAEAQSRLLSLRRSVDNLSDLNAIIAEYHHFLDQYKDSAIAADAKHDLEMWEQRREQKLVKVAGQWVSQEQRDQLRQQAAGQILRARVFMSIAKPHDAQLLIQQVLAADPGNPSALYLQGLLQFDRQDLPGARKSFEAVLAAVNAHAATSNNLAIILWRQNQTIASINAFSQAMLTQPQTQIVLDNVAEALHALPFNLQKNPAVTKAVQIFLQQDAQLQKQMAILGLHRWGSSWIDSATFDQLQAIQKDVDAAVAKLNAQIDDVRQDMNHLDTNIQQDRQEMQNTPMTIYVTDSKGRSHGVDNSAQVYLIQQSIDKLQKSRNDDQSKIDSLQRDVAKEQAKVTTPKYSGIQKIIGIEQTPGMPPMKTADAAPGAVVVPAATQPVAPKQINPPALPAGIQVEPTPTSTR